MTAKHFVTMMADEWRILDDEENVVAIVPDEESANLYLAAPDLLTALKECSWQLAQLCVATGEFTDAAGNALDKANQALTKAEGKR